MTPKTRKGLVLTGSFLCLLLGFVAGKVKPEAGAGTAPAVTVAEPLKAPPPSESPGPSHGPVIMPLFSDIELTRLDIEHDDLPAWMQPEAERKADSGLKQEAEKEVPPLLREEAGPTGEPVHLEVELAPLCPRADLLLPVPIESLVARRLPSEGPPPVEPRPWPADGGPGHHGGPVPWRKPARPEELPFTGAYPTHLPPDRKVLPLPLPVREQLADMRVLYLRSDREGYVWIGTAAGLERLAVADRKGPDQRRLFFAHTARCRVTADGQLLLPEHLERLWPTMTRSGAVFLIGAGDHFEMWEAARWHEYLQEQSSVVPLRSSSGTAPADKSRYYRVTSANLKFIDIARQTLGEPNRWDEIYRLNPTFNPAVPLPLGTVLLVPAEDPPESKEPLPLDD